MSAPLFASDHVTLPFTHDRQRAVDSLVRDWLWSQTMSPIPAKSDRSGYAEYLMTNHYPLRADIADRCNAAVALHLQQHTTQSEG